jgi:siroheme synthase
VRQADIDAELVALARAGKRVIRLKSGDRSMFGCGGEETQAPAAAGIECEILPGITAGLGCAADAGIPLTHRDHAHSSVFVTGHLSGGALDLDWASTPPRRGCRIGGQIDSKFFRAIADPRPARRGARRRPAARYPAFRIR